ncbi:MerR family transcriptional regulator [Modestobacter sp. URMC 112]
MMLIGEVARLAGVSTRTIRHYHQVGVVPGPARSPSGYREYELPDVLLLIRAVRLAETGLSLPEVADALRDSTGAELRTVLEELLRDIAEQQARLDARRRGIEEMLARGDDLRLAHLVAMPPSIARALEADPSRADAERLAWEAIAAALPADRAESVAESMEAVFSDPGTSAEMAELAALFEALADRRPDDPAVEQVAARMAALAATAPGGESIDPGSANQALYRAYLDTLPPAQRRCLEIVERSNP